MQKDIIFIKSFFEQLEAQEIRYCILRKYKEIFHGNLHDVDMTVDFKKLPSVLRILKELSAVQGWELFLSTTKDNGNLYACHYYLTDGLEVFIVHLDLFRNFSWNGIPLLKNEDLLRGSIKKEGIRVCSYGVEAVTKLFSRFLYQGHVKEEYKEEITGLFRNSYSETMLLMGLFLNKELAHRIGSFVLTENWEALESLRPLVRENILHSRKRIRRLLGRIKAHAFRAGRYLRHKGVMVAFLGTDGSGKSSIINCLPEVLERSFNQTQIRYYHWRPRLLSGKKRDKQVSSSGMDPHGKKPYGRILSLMKFLYFNLDYILGYWLSVKLSLGKNQLVVFDRYYYDYLLDQYRYRLKLNEHIIRWFSHLIPKPDITFLLVGDPGILYQRKKELPYQEVEQQVNRLLQKKELFPNSRVIDVNGELKESVFNVAKYILDYMKVREDKNG